MSLASHAIASSAPAPTLSPGEANASRRFFGGAAFLVFLFAAVVAYEAFLLVTIFGPTQGGWLSQFVRDFQMWCFRGDPRTGGVSWAAVSIMLLEPVTIVAVAAFFWREFGRELLHLRTWLRHARAGLAGFGLVSVTCAGLVIYARAEVARAQVLPPFPGESIRVKLALPDVPLVDQKGTPFRFSDLRGQVVIVTGVYAMCTTACPEILTEIRRIQSELTPAERADVRVVALSLNPEYETAALMDAVAGGRGFTHPEFRYVNGERPAEMHDVLTRLQFSATRDPRTGIIDHANLFLLVDRHGDIAYRFTLDPRHRAWLREALRALLREPHVTPRAS